MLVGDAAGYNQLHMMMKDSIPLPPDPAELVAGPRQGTAPGVSAAAFQDSAQICSCNGVSKGALVLAVRDGCERLEDLKKCTRAGTGCGGCLSLVAEILKGTLESAGKQVSNHLCEHFPYTRRELFEIVKINKVTTFGEWISCRRSGKS